MKQTKDMTVVVDGSSPTLTGSTNTYFDQTSTRRHFNVSRNNLFRDSCSLHRLFPTSSLLVRPPPPPLFPLPLPSPVPYPTRTVCNAAIEYPATRCVCNRFPSPKLGMRMQGLSVRHSLLCLYSVCCVSSRHPRRGACAIHPQVLHSNKLSNMRMRRMCACMCACEQLCVCVCV